MSKSWWCYRRLGKFLIKLDVITYAQLKAFLDVGDFPENMP